MISWQFKLLGNVKVCCSKWKEIRLSLRTSPVLCTSFSSSFSALAPNSSPQNKYKRERSCKQDKWGHWLLLTLFCSRNSTAEPSLDLEISQIYPEIAGSREKGEGRVDNISAVGVLVRKHLGGVQPWGALFHGVMVSTCTVRTAASAAMQQKGTERDIYMSFILFT